MICSLAGGDAQPRRGSKPRAGRMARWITHQRCVSSKVTPGGGSTARGLGGQLQHASLERCRQATQPQHRAAQAQPQHRSQPNPSFSPAHALLRCTWTLFYIIRCVDKPAYLPGYKAAACLLEQHISCLYIRQLPVSTQGIFVRPCRLRAALEMVCPQM